MNPINNINSGFSIKAYTTEEPLVQPGRDVYTKEEEIALKTEAENKNIIIEETPEDTEAAVETEDNYISQKYMPKSYTKFNFEKMFNDFRQKLMDIFKPISQRQPEPEPEPEPEPFIPIGHKPYGPIHYCMYSIPEAY